MGGAESFFRHPTAQSGTEDGGKDESFQRLETILQRGKKLQATLQKTKESSRDLSAIDRIMVDVLGQCTQLLQQERQVRSALDSNVIT